MTIGFIGQNIFAPTLLGFTKALAMKASVKFLNCRGAIMGAVALCGSCGVLLINGLGGQIFDSNMRNPFYLALAGEILVVLVIVIFAFAQQLHI